MSTTYLLLKTAMIGSLLACPPDLTVRAQNLVPNPSFELYDSLPYAQTQAYFLKNWYSTDTSGRVYPSATPDYFHTNGKGDAALPLSYYGTVNPYSGMAAVGLFCRSHFFEYLQTSLKSALTKGNRYLVSIHITHGYERNYSNNGTAYFGIYFSKNKISQHQAKKLSVNPQIIIPRSFCNGRWKIFSDTIIASEAHQKITLGFFGDTPEECYYFIDDVSVIPIDPEPGDASEEIKQIQTPKMQAGRPVEVQQEVVLDEPFVEIEVFDDQQEDSDVVSVYYNDQKLLNKHELTRKSASLQLFIRSSQDNLFVLYAEDLGISPPNTAAVRLKTSKGKKIYHINSSFQTSGALNLIYEPK